MAYSAQKDGLFSSEGQLIQLGRTATLIDAAAPSVLFRPDPTPLADFLRKTVAVEPSAYAWDRLQGGALPPNVWEKREDTLLIQGSAGMVHLLMGTPTALKKHTPKYAEVILTKSFDETLSPSSIKDRVRCNYLYSQPCFYVSVYPLGSRMFYFR